MLEVSRSGFYDYQARLATPKIDAEEVVLLARVKAIAARAGLFGYPLHAEKTEHFDYPEIAGRIP